MKSQELIQQLIGELQKADAQISTSGINKRINSAVLDELLQLKLENGKISNSVENLFVINRLEAVLKKAILDAGYEKQVKQFAQTFSSVANLQNQYFSSITSEFSPTKALNEIKKQAVAITVNQLTEVGISEQLKPAMAGIIRTAITTGGNMPDLIDQIREYVMGTPERQAAFSRHVKQVSVDSLNQFSAQYSQAITADLGLEWFEYTGSLLETSRPWCQYMVEKRWIHISEIHTVLHDHIDGVKIGGANIPVSKKTGLPQGMMPGTSAQNIQVRRGGFQCGHQWIPITEDMVPQSVKDSLAARQKAAGAKPAPKPAAPKKVAPAKPKPAPAPKPAPPAPAQNPSTSFAVPAPVYVPPSMPKYGSLFKPIKSTDEGKKLAETLLTKHQGISVKQVEIHPSVGVDQLSGILKQMDSLLNEYKMSHRSIDGIQLKVKSDLGSYGYVKPLDDRGGIAVFNVGHTFDAKSRKYDPKNPVTGGRYKSRVDLKNEPIATVTHEFAHTLSLSWIKDHRPFWDEMLDLKKQYLAETRKLARAQKIPEWYEMHLGGYASTNMNEFMAEGFTEYKLSSKPGKYAVKIGQLIDKYFKK